MTSRLSLVACAVLFLSSSAFLSSSEAFLFRKQRYPNCPLTGVPPSRNTNANTRCADAYQMTCCEACTDIRQALGLVSANFSNFVQWMGLLPKDLKMMNGYLNGTDSNMCTIFNLNFAFAGIMGSSCAVGIEQLACAMSCHPNGGDFITRGADGAYELYVCNPAYRKLADDCGALLLPKNLNQHVASYIGYAPQILNDIGNVAWGLSGLPEFRVKYSNATGPPGCWPGPPNLFSPTAACCDNLSTRDCPAGVINFTANPEFRKFADAKDSDVLCRVGKDFETGRNITNFSPPPASPLISLTSPPPAEASSPPAELSSPPSFDIPPASPVASELTPPPPGKLASREWKTTWIQMLLCLMPLLL